EKYVAIRYSMDEWKTFEVTQAEYQDSLGQDGRECDLDRFKFRIDLSTISRAAPISLHFCAHYVVRGCEYWDNNGGNNYVVRLRTFTPISESRVVTTRQQDQ